MRKINSDMQVTTIFGKLVDKKSCITIDGNFYEKNVDCFNINGRWFRKGNPRIYFDAIKNEWRKITPFVINGIIGCENDKYIFGQFEKAFEADYYIDTIQGRHVVCNKGLFNSIPKIYKEYGGSYMDAQYAFSTSFDKSKDRANNSYAYGFERLYNSEGLIGTFSKVDNSKYINQMINVEKISAKDLMVLRKYSFGLEIETANGIIPEFRCKELGLIPLRDGSITGHEYTTIPMYGSDGVNLLVNQMAEIKERCSIDRNCSVHIHFGNYSLDESKILNLYNLCYLLQNEIGAMFPYYIYNSGNYKSNGKDYCKKLPSRQTSIKQLYTYLADGNASWQGSFTEAHPSDPRRDRKWEIHQRYYYVNFINMLFGNGAKTVEFRIHSATTNSDKLVNWLYICMAILNYAENNLISETPMTLSEILEFSYSDKTVNILNDYIEVRKQYHKTCQQKYSDTYGYFDIQDDKTMSFKTPLN